MHIVVTDVVTCPRCGPEFGLIILADRLEDRRVVEGWLGCANCREEYPVRGGIADLRWGPTRPLMENGREGDATAAARGRGAMADPEKPLRMAALLGITGPSGPVAVVTSDTDLVRQIQGFLPDTGIVGVSGVAPAGGGEVGMGWALASGGLPFGSRSLGGVVLASGDATEQVGEALRVLARGARVVIDPAPPGIAEALLLEGGDLLLEQDGVAVAFDPRAG